MWTSQYFVRLVDFPAAVEGVTVPNDDGTFDIYISRHLSPERQKECLEHELRHVNLDHFYSPRPVTDLECEADGLTILALDVPDPASIPHFANLSALRGHILRLTSAKKSGRLTRPP